MSAPDVGPGGREESSFARIARDFLVASAFCYAPTIIMAWLKSLTGEAAWALYGWVLLLIPFIALYFLGPICVLICGVFLKRPGLIVSPLLLIAVVILVPLGSRIQRVIALRSYATVNLEPAREKHTIVAFDGSVLSCDSDCQKRAVAVSGYQIATRRQPTDPWKVLRHGQGEECESSDNAKSAAEFLRLGYVGRCAISINQPNLTNALILGEYLVPTMIWGPKTIHVMPKELAGIEVVGHVTEVSEKIDGRERLLGRHISGWLESPLPLGLQPYDVFSGLAIDIGPKLDLGELTAEALDVPPADLHTTRRR